MENHASSQIQRIFRGKVARDACDLGKQNFLLACSVIENEMQKEVPGYKWSGEEWSGDAIGNHNLFHRKKEVLKTCNSTQVKNDPEVFLLNESDNNQQEQIDPTFEHAAVQVLALDDHRHERDLPMNASCEQTQPVLACGNDKILEGPTIDESPALPNAAIAGNIRPETDDEVNRSDMSVGDEGVQGPYHLERTLDSLDEDGETEQAIIAECALSSSDDQDAQLSETSELAMGYLGRVRAQLGGDQTAYMEFLRLLSGRRKGLVDAEDLLPQVSRLLGGCSDLLSQLCVVLPPGDHMSASEFLATAPVAAEEVEVEDESTIGDLPETPGQPANSTGLDGSTRSELRGSERDLKMKLLRAEELWLEESLRARIAFLSGAALTSSC